MADTRTPRDLVSRDKTARAVYVPPSALPDPTPEPGWSYRWVATHVNGQASPNFSLRMREGWVPVKAEDLLHRDDVTFHSAQFGQRNQLAAAIAEARAAMASVAEGSSARMRWARCRLLEDSLVFMRPFVGDSFA